MTTPNGWQPDPARDDANRGDWGYGQGGSAPAGSGEGYGQGPYGGEYQGYGQAPGYGAPQDRPYGAGPEPGYGSAPGADYGGQQPSYDAPSYGSDFSTERFDDRGMPYGGGQTPPIPQGPGPVYGGNGAGGTPPRKGGFPVWGWALAAVAAVAVIGLALAFILPNVFGRQAERTPGPETTTTTEPTTSSGPTSSSSATSSPTATPTPTQPTPNGRTVPLSERTSPASVTMGFTGTGNGYGSVSSSSTDDGKGTVDRYVSTDGRCTASIWHFTLPGGYSSNDQSLTEDRYRLDTESNATGVEPPSDYSIVAADGTTYQMRQYKIRYNQGGDEEWAFSRTFAGLGDEVIFSLTCDPGQLTQERIDAAGKLVTLDVK